MFFFFPCIFVFYRDDKCFVCGGCTVIYKFIHKIFPSLINRSYINICSLYDLTKRNQSARLEEVNNVNAEAAIKG